MLAALALCACDWGGGGTSPAAAPARISPGIYVTDFAELDPLYLGKTGQLLLDSAGTYRLFWIDGNVAGFQLEGEWKQEDGKLIVSGLSESWSDGGWFEVSESGQDDSALVRDITDSGFVRRESLEHPDGDWIAYRKGGFPALRAGDYRGPGTDSGTTTRLLLSAGDYVFGLVDTARSLETYQARGTWRQEGSLLITEANEERSYVDSLGAFSEWRKLAGRRTRSLRKAGADGFEMWGEPAFELWGEPADPAAAGRWLSYKMRP
jgi:hypothetical protein